MLRRNDDYGIAGEFLEQLFPRNTEREMILNWLAWNLQNEDDKPTWAPFLYSRTKGSGKSTFCHLASVLFGMENSVIRHRCHNRMCINPEHLTIGNRADNKRDDWEYLANGVDFDLL